MLETNPAMNRLLVRALFGGLLMGCANLVPGISGGTMLLAAGIYSAFIGSIAEIFTFKFKLPSLIVLAGVGAAAGTTILLGAGIVKDLVVFHRWIMYSLFIGLTLGGVPLIWKMAQVKSLSFWLGTLGGLAVMVVMALGVGGGGVRGDAGPLVFFFGGVAGAAAMILPGVSGGYLLLLLGLYETILSAIDQVKVGVSTMDLQPILSALPVVVPVGVGVILGIAGISTLLKWLLHHKEEPTLGTLLGLLLGAFIGLWPFQAPRSPIVGEILKGKMMTPELIEAIKPEKWPLEIFNPTLIQICAAISLILFGLALTLGIDRFGQRLSEKHTTEPETI